MEFKAVNGIRQNQNFKFSADELRIYPAYRFSDATRPDVVPAAGLSPSRLAYLYVFSTVRLIHVPGLHMPRIRRRCVKTPNTPYPRAQRLSPSTPTAS
ncbi:hypothetical protein DPMN_078366 [Dreissena polymorpha]|uniref:Uncharacterized protein n=1 Tax=Dreissena polymorpha TaxID=45954 RepID=A0A9D3YMJ7_DREPO|nr:hypothetical protein DPMN_078366 [Dreissena polymorpha]